MKKSKQKKVSKFLVGVLAIAGLNLGMPPRAEAGVWDALAWAKVTFATVSLMLPTDKIIPNTDSSMATDRIGPRQDDPSPMEDLIGPRQDDPLPTEDLIGPRQDDPSPAEDLIGPRQDDPLPTQPAGKKEATAAQSDGKTENEDDVDDVVNDDEPTPPEEEGHAEGANYGLHDGVGDGGNGGNHPNATSLNAISAGDNGAPPRPTMTSGGMMLPEDTDSPKRPGPTTVYVYEENSIQSGPTHNTVIGVIKGPHPNWGNGNN